MTATDTRARRPQLADTIGRLNAVIDGLSEAVPEVVADTLKTALGVDFAAALGTAVAAALAPAVRDLARAEVAAALAEQQADRAAAVPDADWGTAPLAGPAPAVPAAETETAPVPPMPATVPSIARPTLAARVRRWLETRTRTAREWVSRQWQPVAARVTVVAAVGRLLAAAVAHAPGAVPAGLVAAAAFGTAAVTDPAAAAVLAGFSGGSLVAVAVAVIPLARATLPTRQPASVPAAGEG